MISKMFEKLENNRLLTHLEKNGLFHDFHYGFSYSWPTADLLTVVFDRTARALNNPGATGALAIDTSKTFGRAWHANLF